MKKVALVGFALSTRMQAPVDDPSIEIWGCNEGYVLPPFAKKDPRDTASKETGIIPALHPSRRKWAAKPSRWLQLHNYQTISRALNHNDEYHFEWLKSATGFPIYMQRKFPMIPESVVYPIDEIIEMTGGRYFTSSFAYMIALAIYEGFDWIGCYGFEMATDSEYFHQRSNAEYLIGFARGKGIHVELPDNGNLLRGRMYAYEDESIGYRQQLEFRQKVLQQQLQKVEKDFFLWQGRTAMVEEIATGKATVNDELLLQTRQAMINHSALGNTINGAIKEIELMQKIYDGHNGTKAVENVLKEEIK